MAIRGIYFNLPVATLQTLLTNTLNALTAILTTGQSYSIGGRALTRADLPKLEDTIQELQFAIDRANGSHVTQTYANMNPNPVLSGPQTNYQATAPGG